MSKQQSKEPAAFKVIARAPFELYYEGDATAVSATNEVGRFDVLPGHTDFFSMLTADDIIIQPPEGEEVTIPTNNGIIMVRDGETLLFLNI